jgi:hypothetical protein
MVSARLPRLQLDRDMPCLVTQYLCCIWLGPGCSPHNLVCLPTARTTCLDVAFPGGRVVVRDGRAEGKCDSTKIPSSRWIGMGFNCLMRLWAGITRFFMQ